MEDERAKQPTEQRTETNKHHVPFQHIAELTGFHQNDQEKRQRRRRSGSSDKALVSLPIERPRSHISLCKGETE